MKDKKLILLIVLCIVAVGSLIYGIVTPSKTKRELSSGTQGGATASAEQVKNFDLAVRSAKKSTYETWGRNPFLLKEAASGKATGLILNGIAWYAENPRAVINDKILGEGAKINGNRVVKIEQNRVILNDGESDLELRLGRKP